MISINLINGTLETTANLDGWVITSKTAIAEGAEDMPLRKGDRIGVNGNVTRNGEDIGNIA